MSFAVTIDVSEQTWLTRDQGFCDWLKSCGLVPENIYRIEIYPNGMIRSYEFHNNIEGRKHVIANCDDPDGETLAYNSGFNNRDSEAGDPCRLIRDTRTNVRPLTIEFKGDQTRVAA